MRNMLVGVLAVVLLCLPFNSREVKAGNGGFGFGAGVVAGAPFRVFRNFARGFAFGLHRPTVSGFHYGHQHRNFGVSPPSYSGVSSFSFHYQQNQAAPVMYSPPVRLGAYSGGFQGADPSCVAPAQLASPPYVPGADPACIAPVNVGFKFRASVRGY